MYVISSIQYKPIGTLFSPSLRIKLKPIIFKALRSYIYAKFNKSVRKHGKKRKKGEKLERTVYIFMQFIHLRVKIQYFLNLILNKLIKVISFRNIHDPRKMVIVKY